MKHGRLPLVLSAALRGVFLSAIVLLAMIGFVTNGKGLDDFGNFLLMFFFFSFPGVVVVLFLSFLWDFVALGVTRNTESFLYRMMVNATVSGWMFFLIPLVLCLLALS